MMKRQVPEVKKEISRAELTEFLIKLGIKTDGIMVLLKTFPAGNQLYALKKNTESNLTEGMKPKEAVIEAWKWVYYLSRLRRWPKGMILDTYYFTKL